MLITSLAIGGLILLLILWNLWQEGLLPFLARRAAQRAEQLLREHLTSTQYQQLCESGYIEIPSKLYPGRFYRIFARRQQVQVYMLGEAGSSQPRQRLFNLCIVPFDPVPDGDLILAYKWMIEGDEQTYLATANHIPKQLTWAATNGYVDVSTICR
jgi:hypothetical protein